MLCQHCQRNEADRTILFHWMGMNYEMHLCQECIDKMRSYAESMGQPGVNMPRRQLDETPFPSLLPETVKNLRKLNALKYQLAEAEEQERYEEAARLRDEIIKMKSEVYAHES